MSIIIKLDEIEQLQSDIDVADRELSLAKERLRELEEIIKSDDPDRFEEKTMSVEWTVQPQPFVFSPDVYPYIFCEVISPAGLILRQVGWQGQPYSYYQDAAQRHVFYYLPDCFKLARKTQPPYSPDLQVNLIGIDGSPEQSQVRLHYLAMPFTEPERLKDTEAKLTQFLPDPLPDEITGIEFRPLAPERQAVRFRLKLAKGFEERYEAVIDLRNGIKDTLTLPASDFQAIFEAMRSGSGPIFQGRIEVDQSDRQESIPFTPTLDDLEGELFTCDLVGPADNGATYSVKIRNAIESPITLHQAVIELLADATANRWVQTTIQPGTLPLVSASGAETEIFVSPVTPIQQAWQVKLEPIRADVNLDFPALWRSILETPGWDDITHKVTARIAGYFFDGPQALDKVIVTFNNHEASVELTRDKLSESVVLTKNWVGYLLNQPTADDYFYHVASYRRNAQGEDVLVAEDDGYHPSDVRTLDIVPPPD